MRLSIRHTTRYNFGSPVMHALQRLRLTPKATHGQEIIEWAMEYENAEPEISYEDQHHNTVTLVAVAEGAETVTVTCHGVVDTSDKSGVIGHHSGHLPLWSFIGQTDHTRPGPQMEELARQVKAVEGSRIDMLHALSSAVSDKVTYRTGTTDWQTTAEQAIGVGSGVCQDHAHIFIGVARMLGIPARYVSGYLMMNDRIDQEASHAWAEAHIDGLGWVGFDVSNGICPDERYVRVATGRDYRDAAPVTGISFGPASTKLEVAVAVEQQPQVQQ
ncbi:transglutaminase family protein [Qipengyuania marisflavi]|uniref:Transglutaminase family protein n=1 Tax=Qipengyuania marisflavi TaxID=2486356 RepID=A0A5S3Q217_9SPHN|nr:transglutaminase family protein [Qipengyuania marisflavi]TMM50407.1 transglutaminase family protein [Qipengyuania marisflavi]